MDIRRDCQCEVTVRTMMEVQLVPSPWRERGELGFRVGAGCTLHKGPYNRHAVPSSPLPRSEGRTRPFQFPLGAQRERHLSWVHLEHQSHLNYRPAGT